MLGAVRLSFVLLVVAAILEALLFLTAEVGVTWNQGLRFWVLETTFIVLILIVIGSMVISMVGKRIVKPFHELQTAIREVSRGNFDVNVQYHGKDEFAEVIRCFNQMVVELNGIETMRNDYINIFSHECKTPIASIRGFAKQLKRSDLTESEKSEYLDIIISESDRLLHMYQNILAICKYENQEIISNQEEFHLDEQVRQCILLLQKDWDRKQIQMEVEVEPILYYGNEEMMRQIWINLLSNAVKFSQIGGRIAIHSWQSKDQVYVSVEDYGEGMDVQTQSAMFDKFFSGKGGSQSGTGLGLAIVKRIVDLCSGEIQVSSKLGEGTKIVVQLPNGESRL